MKKSILLLVAIFTIAISFNSCKETSKKEDKKDAKEETIQKEGELANDVYYQCPMDCEKGKKYDKEGKCPSCEMALKKYNSDEKHSENCKCLEGGECKCEEGKCKCKANEAKAHSCEPGKCECKAKKAKAHNCEPGNCECKA